MEEKCFVCCKPLSDDKTVVVKRGIETLRAASKKRNDGKIKYIHDAVSIEVHIDCRRNYVRKSSIAAFVLKREREEAIPSTSSSPPRTKLRLSKQSSFDFEALCLFCGNEANEDKELKKEEKKRRRISSVSTQDFKNSIIRVADTVGSDLVSSIKNRIISEDLVAVKTKYHLQCYLNFFHSLRMKGSVGRPVDLRVEIAMKEIFFYLENNDDCQFTLKELINMCTEYTPTETTVKTKLKEKYEERILISTKSNNLTIVGFIGTLCESNLELQYDKRSRNEEKRHEIINLQQQ